MAQLTNDKIIKARNWYDGLSWIERITINKPFRNTDVGMHGTKFYTYVFGIMERKGYA